MSGPGLLPRALSCPEALTQVGGPLLMSVPAVATEGHKETCSLCRNLKPCWYLWVTLPPEPNRTEWLVMPPRAMVSSISNLCPRTISVSMDLLQPGSVLIPMTPVTIEGQADTQGLSCNLGTCWCRHRGHVDLRDLQCQLRTQ